MLLNSKLPVDVLGRVWDLSDIDGDGFLDREEFAIVCVFFLEFYSDCDFDIITNQGSILSPALKF